jgi:hypothetical protein
MRKIVLAALAIALFPVFNACKKSSSNSSARTEANLSGSYNLTAVKGVILGQTINLYDSLPVCERDNVIQLETGGIANFIDADSVCSPPSDSTGTWSLSQNTDTLYIGNQNYFINSWDGKTLILNNNQTFTGIPFPVSVTATLVKQ